MCEKFIEWITQCEPEVFWSGMFAILGSIIGSVSTVLLTKMVQKHGKITLHAKIVGSRIDNAHRTWGYRQIGQWVSFHIPLWLDICNTSDVSKVVRNVNLCIVKNRTIIADFSQFQGNEIDPKKPNAIILGNAGAYSFVIPPNNVLRTELEFGIKKNDLRPEDQDFDSIYLTYSDEKDCLQVFFLEKIPSPQWVIGELPKSRQWKTLKKVKFSRLYKYRSEN